MNRIEVKEALMRKASDELINIKGWVKTKRGSKNVAFIALNDGSTINSIQVVAEDNIPEDVIKLIHSGTSISVNGALVVSKGSGQALELLAQSIEIMGHLQ